MKKSIWITPLLLNEVNERAQDSLCSHLGIEFIEVGDDFLTARMPVNPHTLQPMGILHGGASAALAESVGSAAANYCVDQTKYVCVGLDLNINHLRSVKKGFVQAIARPFHLGRTTQVWEIQIFEEAHQRIAVARLTMMVLEK